MAKKSQYYSQVATLYMQGQSPEKIAQVMPISAKSIRQWIRDEGLDKKRQLALSSGREIAGQIESVLMHKLASMKDNPDLATPGELDGIYKSFSLLEKIRKGTYALSSAAVEVFDKFVRYLVSAEDDQDFKDRLSGHIRDFMSQLEG